MFFVGNQPRFETTMIHQNVNSRTSSKAQRDRDGEGDEEEDEEEEESKTHKMVRLIAVPRFRETGQVVLLDLNTLDVELLQFEVFS